MAVLCYYYGLNNIIASIFYRWMVSHR